MGKWLSRKVEGRDSQARSKAQGLASLESGEVVEQESGGEGFPSPEQSAGIGKPGKCESGIVGEVV